MDYGVCFLLLIMSFWSEDQLFPRPFVLFSGILPDKFNRNNTQNSYLSCCRFQRSHAVYSPVYFLQLYLQLRITMQTHTHWNAIFLFFRLSKHYSQKCKFRSDYTQKVISVFGVRRYEAFLWFCLFPQILIMNNTSI